MRKSKAKEEQIIDWRPVHLELRQKGTTLRSVWSEYHAQYSYEQFCRYYKQWRKTLNILVRNMHKAGDELLVAHLEPNLPFHVLDAETGEVHPASLFVAVLPASNYCFAEVCVGRNIINWIECHTHAFQFFGGVAKTLVSEPEDYVLTTHALFKDMLKNHRIRSKIAAGAKRQVPALLLRWLGTALSGKTFLGVAEANAAILVLIEKFHGREFVGVPGSPNEWFASIERASLSVFLPPGTKLVEQKTDIPVTPEMVEALFDGKRIAARINANTTKTNSKPQAAVKAGATVWSTTRVRRWATAVGPATSHIVAIILSHAQNSQRGVCSCLGILSLEKEYGSERLEETCKRAAVQMNWTISSIRYMLEEGLDQTFVQLTIPQLIVPATKTKPRKKRD